jgi:hypothetical protein
MEHDMIGIELAHELGDWLSVERRAHLAVADMTAGGEGQFRTLHVEPGVGEHSQGAGMVVMQMGEDHVLDREVVDPRIAQAFDHRPGDDPPARGRRLFAEAGIDDHRRVPIAVDRPNVVVERHRQVVIVYRAREVAAGGPLVTRVADRVDAGDGGCHRAPPHPHTPSSFPRKREPRVGRSNGRTDGPWVPAFAGMTREETGVTEEGRRLALMSLPSSSEPRITSPVRGEPVEP